MNKPVYILAAGGGATGGVELLHQLAHTLDGFGVNAKMLYHPFAKTFPVVDQYKDYGVAVSSAADVPPGSIVVIPEVYTYLVDQFKHCDVYLWWLSVDNYVSSGKLKYALGNRFLPWKYVDVEKRKFPKHVKMHLVQSEYGRLFLQQRGISNSYNLSDYLNPGYLDRSKLVDLAAKQDIVAYNPAKGAAQTAQIIEASDPKMFRPIVGMTRDGVMDLLASAKVYIDFGNHPGKDRIPREAAVMGCCVIANRRGSAANDVDMPIDPDYKIDDRVDGFAEDAARMIRAVLEDSPVHHRRFEGYRSMIFSEPAKFVDDARSIFS